MSKIVYSSVFEKENLTDKELLDLARKCGLDSIG